MKKNLFLLVAALVVAATTTVTAYSQQGGTTENVLDKCEVMPEYPGGMGEMMGFVSKNLQYPAEAKEAGVQGAVVVQFVVDKTGKITSPKVLKGLSPECDAEVLRVVSLMPQWKPGMQDGEAVNVKYTLPIMFKL